ncbi:hypothetical protein D3C85_1004450 [compost metagenome]
MVTPMIRPGIERLYSSLVAKNAACGPPKPIGIPKRCVVPTTISAPHSPGGVNKVKLKISAATVNLMFKLCNSAAKFL